MDAALRLDDHPLPDPGICPQEIAEFGFAGSAAVDIRVVEEIDPEVEIVVDKPVDVFRGHAADPHTALRDAGTGDVREGKGFHKKSQG